MQIQISILEVKKVSKTTAKGKPYFQLEVAYKELSDGGKVGAQKLNPFFKTADAHKALSDAQFGEIFNITKEKGEPNAEGKSFWEWQGAVRAAPGAAPMTAPVTTGGATSAPAAGGASRSGNYESAEERATRQVLIVKQSSLSAAVATLAPGAKGALDPAKVKQLAQEYTDFVFGKQAEPNVLDLPNDLDSDIPY
jgi:hypothetical protein